MRIERVVTTVSWIPSDMLQGVGRMGTRLHMVTNDPPPPDSLGADPAAAIEMLRTSDRLRFANMLRAYADFDDDDVVTACGHVGGGVIGATTVAVGIGAITIPAVMLGTIRAEPETGEGWARFRQTVGGRTGAPLPRPVKRPPFVQYRAPITWTTLELTIHADGSHDERLVGAAPFPRHWVYGDDGQLIAKSSVAAYRDWAGAAFGHRTPWGDQDAPALVSAVESALERELSSLIMRGGAGKARIAKIKEGTTLVQQGADDDRLFLLLDGVLRVEVDGQPLAEIGPGTVLGERAVLEGGRRSATLTAVTPCKLAVVAADQVDRDHLAALANGHRREDRHDTLISDGHSPRRQLVD